MVKLASKFDIRVSRRHFWLSMIMITAIAVPVLKLSGSSEIPIVNGDFEGLFKGNLYVVEKITAPEKDFELGLDVDRIVTNFEQQRYERLLKYFSAPLLKKITGLNRKELRATFKEIRGARDVKRGKPLKLNDRARRVVSRLLAAVEARDFGPQYPNVLVIKKDKTYAKVALAVRRIRDHWQITDILRLSKNGKIKSFLREGGVVARGQFNKKIRYMRNKYRVKARSN